MHDIQARSVVFLKWEEGGGATLTEKIDNHKKKQILKTMKNLNSQGWEMEGGGCVVNSL